ncbi:unnamed protein product [Didymodactylos carnosus]|uniref:RZ-type domain-containing protein n=1 Tax=Didymodactylos carnosus TaxID=1234261 RepID=A0A815E8Y8_9BILA|nr:unnamed protein product [Didymodactylos carnosus]CAF1309289.1 unnamed protein product [Didymodactylos carnosus]CAF3951895.1 unnamed protein product [Didymodactylos carnosus]CAF4145355.1 unnamed protein product [Didymodactylos carnosus]
MDERNQDSLSERQKQLFGSIRSFLAEESVWDNEPFQKLVSLKRAKGNMSELDYVENTFTFLKEMRLLRIYANKERQLNSSNYCQFNSYIDRIMNDCEIFDALYNEMKTMLNLPGLGITNDERIQIVNALNLKQGHWFICSNGHPYVIGECGGANQRSRCPECNSEIGGENHRLVSTNQHFGIMNNSTTAAYSNNAGFNAADWI